MTDFEHQDVAAAVAQAQDDLIGSYQRVFSGPDAGPVLKDLIREGKVFNGTESDAEEGKRVMVLYILRLSGTEAKIKQLVGGL